MKKSPQTRFFILVLLLLNYGLNAQDQSKIWTLESLSDIKETKKELRKSTPKHFELYLLNLDALKSALSNAPSRSLQKNSSTIIQLPTNNGVIERFQIEEASVLDATLQNRFPNIRSYVGQGIDDPSAIARFSISLIGVHIMISSINYKTIYIDPFTKDLKHYISYSKNDLERSQENFKCLVKTSKSSNFNISSIETKNANDGKLRTFRLALACTGEYAQYHLKKQDIPNSASDDAKKGAVLAVMNTSMTRVNSVYERDLALTMVIVNNNTDIIFLDEATDPYSNNDGGSMLDENQKTIDAKIGSENYDIGHVFSTGGGGVAALNAPCSNYKAEGVTGHQAPVGDPFEIDYVAHEMGHQFGAEHTQNNNCNNSYASVEPGSASTIMGYAGICNPNVQNNSDAYFHAISIAEMWNNITNGNSVCSTKTDTNNNAPTADAGSDFTIPASTPFILRGKGTDSDNGNMLSYCWEQMDNEKVTMPPSSSSTGGPAFRSFFPKASPNRYMPDITTVLEGQTASTWEVVPSVSRTMKFKLTIRDNVANGGSNASDDMIITVDGNSGPFTVTSQDNQTNWEIGSTQTVTWNVANTNSPPVDSPNVDILLSVDGGNTFTQTLASTIPNNGSATITVPSVNTNAARIMVAGSNHLFYNVNTINFAITGTLATEEFAIENLTISPNPTNDSFNILFTPRSNEDISIKIYDLSGRLIRSNTFKNDFGSEFKSKLSLISLNSGVYLVSIKNGINHSTKRIIKH